MKDPYTIILRTCESVLSVHGGGGRILGLTKKEIILGCLKSLLTAAATTNCKIVVVDDHSSDECVAQMKELLDKSGKFYDLIRMEETGNDKSLERCYGIADYLDGLIYFVEDDYLHCPEALEEMLDTYVQVSTTLNQPIILHPCDYPDRYRENYVSYVLKGSRRHWRSILHTTGTFMLPKNLFSSYRGIFSEFARTVQEGETINKIYKEVPCLSPLPSLALHFHNEDHMSPFINWKQWWEQANGSR